METTSKEANKNLYWVLVGDEYYPNGVPRSEEIHPDIKQLWMDITAEDYAVTFTEEILYNGRHKIVAGDKFDDALLDDQVKECCIYKLGEGKTEIPAIGYILFTIRNHVKDACRLSWETNGFTKEI